MSPVRNSTSRRITARSLTAVRWCTSPSGDTNAEKPVGAAWTTQRPVSRKRAAGSRRSAATAGSCPVAGSIRRIDDDAGSVADTVAGRRRTPPTRWRRRDVSRREGRALPGRYPGRRREGPGRPGLRGSRAVGAAARTRRRGHVGPCRTGRSRPRRGTITWALVNRSSSPATSSVTPTEIGTSRQAASAATAALGTAGELRHVDHVLGPQHQVELVVRVDRAVASTWRWVTRALGTSSASPVRRRPARRRCRGSRPCLPAWGSALTVSTAAAARSPADARRVSVVTSPRRRASTPGETDLEHHPREQDHPAGADDSGERAGSLGNP